MAENLKQKLKNKALAISTFVWLSTVGKTFAANEDEFFDAAMNVEGTTPVEPANVAEQTATAVQPDNAGNIVQRATDSLQNFGGNIGDSISSLTHANPFVTKLAVAMILVLISIVIIVIMILLAKKFVFKKHTMQQLSEDYDESEYDDFEEDEIEQEEENLPEPEVAQEAPKERESHTMIPPKSKIEPEIKKPQQNTETVESAMKIFLKVTED